MASRLAERKRNIADSVASMLTFEAPLATALLRVGVSKSMLLRVLACAWDCQEKCAHHVADEDILSLAIVRVSVKLDLHQDVHNIALQFLGTNAEKPALPALECRLAMMMWGEGSLWRGEEGKEEELTKAEQQIYDTIPDLYSTNWEKKKDGGG